MVEAMNSGPTEENDYITPAAKNAVADFSRRKESEMDSFVHLVGDSWSMWSPFPPIVTAWLVRTVEQLWEWGILR